MGIKSRTKATKPVDAAAVAENERLLERVRIALGPGSEITERKMFGGFAFMVNGNMACGVNKGDLMVRVGPDQFHDALSQPHARPMDFTGRPLKGFVYVDSTALDDAGLSAWVKRGYAFAASLPPK